MWLCLFLAALPAVDAGCTVTAPTCYVDDQDRILGHDNVNAADGLSTEYCAQLCSDLGKAIAGVEFGIQCYCGDSIRAGASVAPAGDCGMECVDYPSQKCGGTWRLSAFKVNCSGTPVPPPPESPRMVNPCRNASGPFASLPFCDVTLPIDERVKDAVGRMTLAEKITNLGTAGGAIAGLGVPAYNWWSEATHGVATGRTDSKTPWMTNFAFPITTAMSFNRSLWAATGRQIAREARAFMNVGNGFSTFWAPVINLAREPRWGRNLETPGEDPYLSGEYATNFIQGFQNAPEDPTHIQASACCKHYIANEMDDSTEVGVHHWRDEFNAIVSMQDLVDSYMVPFQACVEKGKVTGLMCSYNAVNGIPSCANDWLLQTVARDNWGFDGYVTSDCDADDDVFNRHNYTKTPEEAVAAVLRAGTDVDCGGFVSQYAQSALTKGVITEADIDTRLRLLFRVRFRLGHFDPEGPLDQIGAKDVCTPEAIEMSFDGAAQGSTLIKNVGSTLPLAKTLKSVAVIGPNAKLAESIAGYYGPSHVCGNKFWTMVDAVGRYVSNVSYAPGVPTPLSADTSLIPAAVKLAQEVDVVVLVVGSDLNWASEGHDAVNITFSSGQLALIQQVAAAAKKPVVLVTLTAVPLDLTDQLANPKIGAILHAGQPSITTPGVADVLFGTKVPAGRLIQTILPQAYQHQISIFDFNMRPGPSVWPRPDCTVPLKQCPNGTNPGRTHRFYSQTPVVPFGFGLSYTTFKYSLAAFPDAPVSLDPVRKLLQSAPQDGLFFPASTDVNVPLTSYAINVTNTGTIDADDAVLGFLVPPGAGQGGVPLQTLFGFDRVHVKAGQTVTVWLFPNLNDFTQVLVDGRRQAAPGVYTFRFGVQQTAIHGQGFVEHFMHAF